MVTVPQIVGPIGPGRGWGPWGWSRGWGRRRGSWPVGLPRRRLYGTGAGGVPVRAFIMDVHASGAVTTYEVGRVWGGREYRAKSIVGQVATPIEVDLLDGDGVIVSIAAVDPNFWAASSAQATTYAQQHGFDFYVPGGPPGQAQAERNVASMPAVQNWIASQSVGVTRKPAGASLCAEESGTPCTLTDADCVTLHGRGWSAVHQQCVQSWSADGTTPTMGPCDWCKSGTAVQIIAGLAVYIPAAAAVGAIAHWGFGLAAVPSVAVGLAVPLAITFAFMWAVGGTM